jgi:oxygen-independent coproporphyrinogen-3 oxidase
VTNLKKNLSIYIHYPFCLSKCPYCDFNSHVSNNISEDKFASAYLKELEYFSLKLKNRHIKTIFFGGGTPSLMPIKLVEKILNKISKIWSIDKNVEISLEANPTSFEFSKFIDFKKAGINRISIGIQSLNNQDLKFLGRNHDASEAINAIKNVSKIFDNYSFDLIYALPKQTLESWKLDLQKAINIGSNHLSLYQLTIEKGTPFYQQHKNKEFILPNDDLAADFYNLTNDVTKENGLENYEISNYAKTRYECHHNLTYWEYNDYLGIGAGAHSRVSFDDNKKRKIMMLHNPQKWQDSIIKNGNAIQEIGLISQDEILQEIVIMGLRLKKGINNSVFQKYFSKNYSELLNLEILENLRNEGFVNLENESISITKKGRILTNSIIDRLL